MAVTKGEIITKDTKIPKYFRTKQGRILVGTVTLYKNRIKLGLETVSDSGAKEIDKEEQQRLLLKSEEVTSAQKEAERIISEAQTQVKAKTAQVATSAEIEAKKVIDDAKAQAAKIIKDAEKKVSK